MDVDAPQHPKAKTIVLVLSDVPSLLVDAWPTGRSASRKNPSEAKRIIATGDLLRRYRLLLRLGAIVPNELEDFIAAAGRTVFSSKDPIAVLSTFLGAKRKTGRPANTECNKETAFRVRSLVRSGWTREKAIAEVAGETKREKQTGRHYYRHLREARARLASEAMDEIEAQLRKARQDIKSLAT